MLAYTYRIWLAIAMPLYTYVAGYIFNAETLLSLSLICSKFYLLFLLEFLKKFTRYPFYSHIILIYLVFPYYSFVLMFQVCINI